MSWPLPSQQDVFFITRVFSPPWTHFWIETAIKLNTTLTFYGTSHAPDTELVKHLHQYHNASLHTHSFDSIILNSIEKRQRLRKMSKIE